MKLLDILKSSCKIFSMKFLEVNNFLINYLQYFAKKVERNFMKEFSCEQKKKIQYDLWNKIYHSSFEIHYFTVFTATSITKPRSEPADCCKAWIAWLFWAWICWFCIMSLLCCHSQAFLSLFCSCKSSDLNSRSCSSFPRRKLTTS